MCGIIGEIQRNKQINPVEFNALRDTLAHRGPDDAHSIFFEDNTLALGHRRLSFLDLTEAGRQPMCNEDETVWIVLNGEIYNYVELKQQLIQLGHQFKTHSDTEVIIHGYEQWGEGVLQYLKGMFAFAVLDTTNKTVFLARDRFGIKPMYYQLTHDRLIFASELKALVSKNKYRVPDASAIADYLVYRYIPSPKTIWWGIAKLPPAHSLTLNYKTWQVTVSEYWQLKFENNKVDSDELVHRVGDMLQTSVAIHARADVPVGSFLSGGYDSSAIVYYLTKAGYKPDTFAIGFNGWDNSEHQYAELVAKHLNVPFNFTMANDATLDIMDIMPMVYDEPIADISILPTWLVSNAAVKKVKAVMSGEGADELFGGYWWEKKFYALAHPDFKERLKQLIKGNKQDTISFYADAMAMGRFDNRELDKALGNNVHEAFHDDVDWFYKQHYDPSLSPLKAIQKMDIKCFMGELVLTKMDRASMANSLEVRVPFLDHELYELVLSKREQDYYKPNTTKYLLHENIKNHLPTAIMDRPKQGFVGPDAFYMNMQRYRDILANSQLVYAGIIRNEYIDELFERKDHWRLWKLAVLEKWYKHWVA